MKKFLCFLLPLFCWASVTFKDEPPPVDVRYGVYAFQSVDWVVSGVEPIELKRSYSSGGRLREMGGWEFWPHLSFKAGKELNIPEPSGKMIYYVRDGETNQTVGYKSTYFQPDAMEGRVNEINNRAFVEKESGNVTVVESSGNTRYYQRNERSQYLLAFEKRPNGNWVCYTYDEQDRLEFINTTNPLKTKTYAWIRCSYPGKGKQERDFRIETSDGHILNYMFERFSWFQIGPLTNIYRYGLRKVFLDGFRLEKYSYEEGTVDEGIVLRRRVMADGREWKIETEKGRAKTVSELDEDGKWLDLYSIGEGEINHLAGDRFVSTWDEYGLSSKEHCGHSKLVQKHNDLGQIVEQKVLDRDGMLISRRQFRYDKQHNVTTETIFANFSGDGITKYEKRYEYSGVLVTKISEGNGVETRIAYLPGTNLVTERTVLVHGEPIRTQIFEYNEDNLLVEEREDGKYRRFTYQNGLAEWIEEGSNIILRKTHNYYNQACQLIREDVFDATNTLRYSLHTTYDRYGKLLSKTDPLGRISTYEYDQRGRLIKATEAGSPCSRYISYGAMTRIAAISDVGFDGITLTTTYQYDPVKRKIISADYFGDQAELVYDSEGHLLSKIIQRRKIEQCWEYDDLGYVSLEKKADGSTAVYQNTIQGKPSEITYPDGTSVSHRYYPNGALRSTLLEDGTRIEFEVDELGRTTKKSFFDPSGVLLSQENWTYGAYHLNSHTDAAGNISTFIYDSSGRKIEEQIGERTIQYSYDSMGFLEKTVFNGILTTSFTNDILGRPIAEKQEDNLQHLINLVEIFYDEFGNRQKICRHTSQGEAIDVYQFDSLRRVIRHQDPLGRSERTEYGLLKQLSRSTSVQFDGQVIEQITDPMGCVRERKSEKGTEKFQYDTEGRKTKYQFNLFEINWSYDVRGRLQMLREKGKWSSEKITRYSYDARGRLIETTKPNGVSLYQSYDFLDRIISQTSSDGTIDYRYSYGQQNDQIDDLIHRLSLTRKYNSLGKLIAETLPNVGEISKEYDSVGRCTKLTLPDRSTVEYHYNPVRIDAIVRSGQNGRYIHQISVWDTDGSPIEEQMIGGLGTVIYENDLLCRREKIHTPFFREAIEQRDFAQRPTLIRHSLSGTRSFCYDDLGQLSCENEKSYSFDSLHNPKSLFVDDLNRFDRTDNLAKFDGWHYSYDALDRLIEAKSDRLSLHFTYDHLHRRLSKRVYENGKLLSELFFLHDELREIGAMDGNGQIVQFRTLHPRGPSETANAVAIELGAQVYAPVHDLQGNVSALISLQTGDLAEAYQYSAFGSHSTPSKNPWRYASKRIDPETGLIFFGRRYYHPELGRWITPDPANFADGPNLYTFLHNDPINHFDAFGLSGVQVGNFNVNFEVVYQTPYGEYSIGTSNKNVSAALPYVFSGIGQSIHFLGWHLLPNIPVVKDAVLILGQCFQLSGFHLERQQVRCNTWSNELKDGLHIILINGVLSDSDDVRFMQRTIENLSGTKVVTIHVDSGGFVTDLIDAVLIYLGIETGRARHCRLAIETYIRSHVGPEEEVLLVAHSKGCVIANCMLERMDRGAKSSIIGAIGVGPAAFISGEPGLVAINLVSPYDVVPFNPLNWLGWVRSIITDDIQISWTQPTGPFLLTHPLSSDPHRHSLQKAIDIFYENRR